MVVNIVVEVVTKMAIGVAFGARAPLAEIIPRVDAVLVAIIPTEANGIVADLCDLGGTKLRLEHGQGFGDGRRGLVGLAVLLFTLLVAEGTRTGVAQIGECVGGLMAVFPDDFHGAAAGFVNLDGGGLRWAHGK